MKIEKSKGPHRAARRRLVGVNEKGRRVGQDHPGAVLTDHEVDLLMEMFEERDALIDDLKGQGAGQGVIEAALRKRGLSFRKLAAKFEVSRALVRKIHSAELRTQRPARYKLVA